MKMVGTVEVPLVLKIEDFSGYMTLGLTAREAAQESQRVDIFKGGNIVFEHLDKPLKEYSSGDFYPMVLEAKRIHHSDRANKR